MSVIETQQIVNELYETIDTMLDKADEIANLRETLVDLQIKLDKSCELTNQIITDSCKISK